MALKEFKFNLTDVTVSGADTIDSGSKVSVGGTEVGKLSADQSYLDMGSFGKITAGYDEIKKIIDNPPENLKFLGIVERKRMNEIFNMADMLFLPSYQELFPMTLLECVNAELPFLVRDLDLYKDIFLSHYLVGHDNDEFSSLINRLKDDKDFYNEIKEDSLKLKEFYSVKNVAKLWDKYYKDIYNKYPNKHW